MKFLFLFLSLSVLGFCQNTDPLVYTVGKTLPANEDKAFYDYLLWQPGDATATFGRSFAVYRKDGDADAIAPFSKISVQKLQTAPAPILAMLKLGAKFGADHASLPERITALHAEALAKPLPEDAEIPTGITPEVAQKLSQIAGIASDNPEVLQSLLSLGRVHPGVMMSIGHAFAIKVDSGSLSTYEIREIDGNGADLRVVGRVTLNQAKPHQLVAPGRPHPNPHAVNSKLQLAASAKDHLNVRLRWSMSDELRTQIPHTYGFNLYRVPAKSVEDPEEVLTADEALEAGGTRVNILPAIAESIMTEAEASNLAVQPEVFFYADDKNPPEDVFQNGETFYYYVSARDIAGHPGPLSPPTEVTMCDRIPPSAARISAIENVFDIENADPGTQTGKQHLRVIIRQVPEAPVEDRAYFYRVYRWEAANDWQRMGEDPEVNLAGIVPHKTGAVFTSFDDNNPVTGAHIVENENDAMMGKTVWYTVRSVDRAACLPRNLSGHSSAVYGVLRDRVGPPNPTGVIERCFCVPRLSEGERIETQDYQSFGLSPDFPGFIVSVDRRKKDDRTGIFKKIKGFQVQVGRIIGDPDKGTVFSSFFNRIYHYEGFQGFAHLPIPREEMDGQTLRVRAFTDDKTFTPWQQMGLQGKGDEGKATLGIYQFLASTTEECERIIDPPGGIPPIHESPGDDGRVRPVCGQVNTNAATREVRIYRRVGHNAPFQMINKLAGDSIPLIYEWKEPATISVNGTEVCYFAQLFDEHGNGSALVHLGCVTIKNDDLGTALLSDPQPLPSNSDKAYVKLSWVCDPVGVDRFEVLAAAEGQPLVELESSQLTGPLEKEAPTTLPISEDTDLAFTTYQTPSLESGYGDGGEFSLITEIPVGTTVYFTVRAVGKMIPGSDPESFSRAEGDFSNTVSTSYVEPLEGPQDVIPWPARPLPTVAKLDIPVTAYERGEGPFYAHAVNPELMNQYKASTLILCGVFPATSNSDKDLFEAGFPAPDNPLKWLFRYRLQSGTETSTAENEAIFPFVVYRHQVPSELFPNAVPNLVQVTPLIDRIGHVPNPADGSTLLARDPLFVFQPYERTFPTPLPVPGSGTFSRDPEDFQTFIPPNTTRQSVPYLDLGAPPSGKAVTPTGIWLRDAVPTTAGARYQYLLVHFNPRGEIQQVIPTNQVQQ